MIFLYNLVYLQHSQPFFKLMSMLVEFGAGPPGLPPFTQYVLQKFWEVNEAIQNFCLLLNCIPWRKNIRKERNYILSKLSLKV